MDRNTNYFEITERQAHDLQAELKALQTAKGIDYILVGDSKQQPVGVLVTIDRFNVLTKIAEQLLANAAVSKAIRETVKRDKANLTFEQIASARKVA